MIAQVTVKIAWGFCVWLQNNYIASDQPLCVVMHIFSCQNMLLGFDKWSHKLNFELHWIVTISSSEYAPKQLNTQSNSAYYAINESPWNELTIPPELLFYITIIHIWLLHNKLHTMSCKAKKARTSKNAITTVSQYMMERFHNFQKYYVMY